MENLKEELLKQWNNFYLDTKLAIVNAMNNCNGVFDDLRFEYNDEEFFDNISYYYGNAYELARAIGNGDYNFNDEYVQLDYVFKTLVSYTSAEVESELDDYKEEIIDNIVDDWDVNDYDVKHYFNLESEEK